MGPVRSPRARNAGGANRYCPPMSSTSPPLGAPVLAGAIVERVRTAWRRRLLAHGTLLAIACAVGIAVLLVGADQLLSLPVAARAMLRLFVPATALVILAFALRRAWPGPSAARLALLAEEREPGAGHVLSAALSVSGDGTVARAFDARAAERLAHVPR
ncbi:MAG TPA: hypothetical protein VFZ93_05040, partial [Albitalea sp.]